MTIPKMNGMATVISGPMGCGKTTNAKRIAKAYGLHATIDDWDGEGVPHRGSLYLTNDLHIDRKLTGKRFRDAVRVTTYSVAMEMVKIDEEGRA